jgi:hypothetical protein
MSEEIKSVTDAVKDAVGNLPPGEVGAHAQSAVVKLHEQGQTDLAKELEDMLRGVAQNPVGIQNAVIGFIEHHPETLAAFNPSLTGNMLGNK